MLVVPSSAQATSFGTALGEALGSLSLPHAPTPPARQTMSRSGLLYTRISNRWSGLGPLQKAKAFIPLRSKRCPQLERKKQTRKGGNKATK